MCESFKNYQFLIKDSKISTKKPPVSTGITFSTNFEIADKVQNTTSWNISNLGLCGNLFILKGAKNASLYWLSALQVWL